MTIVCPYQDCQQQIDVEAQHAGTEATCPTCKRPMQLPDISAFPVEESNPAPWTTDHTDLRRAAGPRPQQQAPAFTTGRTQLPAMRNFAPARSADTAIQKTTRVDSAPAFTSEPALSSTGPGRGSSAAEEGLTPGGAAGCPICMRAFDENVQEFVRELVELREVGSDVSKLGVKCPCGAETKFGDLAWIKNAATDETFRRSPRKASFHPPNSSRDRAKILSDAGFVAVKADDMETAHGKWLQATEADQSWSVPFFNLARLSLDRGDRHAASAFLGLAEDRAQRGSSADDAQVMKQVTNLKAKLEVPATRE